MKLYAVILLLSGIANELGVDRVYAITAGAVVIVDAVLTYYERRVDRMAAQLETRKDRHP